MGGLPGRKPYPESLMPAQTPGQLSDQLRDAIAHRDRLRPGTPAHWRAVCDVRTLQDRLARSFGLETSSRGDDLTVGDRSDPRR
jgi:hypothetical protein